MNKIFLIEDHDEALKVWRKEKVRGLDLVHFDAHLDFSAYEAKPIENVLTEAMSVTDVVKGLEKSIAFTRYERDFNKQTNIGNYIYPAISEGIVKNFYWVIPGREAEFKKSAKIIRNIIKGLTRERMKIGDIKKCGSFFKTNLLGRDFVVCTLDKLPFFTQEILLDIDVDFLVIDSIRNANNTDKIGLRNPWIKPQELILKIREKITSPLITTISYSVNGGWTPMKYKHLGDEIAYNIAPEKFDKRYMKNLKAANLFNLFLITQNKKYYDKAARINHSYRSGDNNYGGLYQLLGRHSRAREEYLKFLRVDPKNPALHLGLGDIALLKKDYKRAKNHFSVSLSFSNGQRMFSNCKKQALFGLATAEFGLKNYDGAKDLFIKCKKSEPLNPHSCFMLGKIFEKQKDYSASALFYKDAMRLGLGNIESVEKLLKASSRIGMSDETLRFIKARLKELEKNLKKLKKGPKFISYRKKLLKLKEKIFSSFA